MAVTQYIGARYVPLIYQNPDDNSNNWKQGVAYEPLTIVSYAGGSYTSKIAVPSTAANPVDAPQYWVPMGLYSGQTSINTNSIIQIRHALANATEAGDIATSARQENDFVWIEGVLYRCTADIAINDHYTEGINVTQVTDLAGALFAISSVFDDLVQNVDNLADDVDALGTLANNTSAVVDRIKGYHDFSTRKVICISDSYGLTPSEASSWIGHVRDKLALPTANFYRAQANSSGFIGLVATTFKVMLQNLAAGMTAEERQNITDIVIGGGFNDASVIKEGRATADELRTAINDCVSYARTTFPSSIIYLFNPGWIGTDATYHAPIRSVINLMQQATAAASKVAYIDNVNWLHRFALLDSTRFHPNAVGAQCIAETIVSVLVGGSPFCDMAVGANGVVNPTISASSSISNLVWTNVRQRYENGTAHMTWQRIEFTPASAIVDGGSIVIGDFTDGIIQGDTLGSSPAVNVSMLGTGGKCGTLIICNNQLLFLNTTGANLPAGTPVKIPFGSLSCSIFN